MTVKRTRYLTHTLFLTLFLCVLHLIKFGRHNFEGDAHRATGPVTEDALSSCQLNILTSSAQKETLGRVFIRPLRAALPVPPIPSRVL